MQQTGLRLGRLGPVVGLPASERHPAYTLRRLDLGFVQLWQGTIMRSHEHEALAAAEEVSRSVALATFGAPQSESPRVAMGQG